MRTSPENLMWWLSLMVDFNQFFLSSKNLPAVVVKRTRLMLKFRKLNRRISLEQIVLGGFAC